MTTIRIADETHPARLGRSDTDGSSTGVTSGIFNLRRIRTASRDRRSLRSASSFEPEDEDPGLRRAGDFKQKQTFHGKLLMWLAYQSIGVIYGDIGTSPLYVYSSTFSEPPVRKDLVGVLSIILWSLIMMVTVKYIIIILHCDNDGEGGTFSTYALLSRYVNITNRDPREASLIQMKRYLSGDLESAGRHMRSGLEKSRFAKGLLKVVGTLAVSMVMSDGVLTPAQSVLGAVQGLNVVTPNISQPTVIGVTVAILILLFLIQPFGLTKIASSFAPIVIIWLTFNACFGIYNLVKYDWRVLEAFNPGYAFEYLARHKTDGWKSLGGILLAFTGVEALFADLGAFSRRAIQISWLSFCLPCLFLAYIGQAAYISVHPDAFDNPFYKSAPPGWLIPSLVIAVLAAIVASQAIITATFQLLNQIMKLSYFPQIKVVHTSKTFHGQMYIPVANWVLMLGTVLVAGIFNNTTRLGNAYGVCVMFVTFFDTCMVSLAAIFVWRIRPYYILPVWLTIACMDGAFLSSALVKVPHGGWFTITVAGVLASCFILWRFGKEQQWAAEALDRFPSSHFVKKQADGQLQLHARYGGGTLGNIPCLGIFFDKAGETTPIVFSQWVTKLQSAPAVGVLLHLRPLESPTVADQDRFTVSRLAIPNFYRLVVRYGYNDEIVNPELASLVHRQIEEFLILKDKDLSPGSSPDNEEPKRDIHFLSPENTNTDTHPTQEPASILEGEDVKRSTGSLISTPNSMDKGQTEKISEDSTASELLQLNQAFNSRVLYIVGKEQLRIKSSRNIIQKILLAAFLWIRENTRTKIANLRVPTEKVFEVGFVKDI